MKDEEKYRRYSEKIRIFNGFQPEEVEHVLHQGKVLHYLEGQTIFHEGMLGSNLFIVLSGEVGIYHKNTLIGVCQVGDAFGEMAILNKKPRVATAAAITDCRLFTLDEKQVKQILDRHVASRLLMNIIHVLSERLESALAHNVELRKKLQELEKKLG
jgi:CRP-like cAMP-binding protein